MALTKVTSGVRTLATDEVGATEIAAGAVGASEIASTLNISSKTVTLPAASVTAHVTQTDTSVLEYNIALLAFKLAAGDSLSKFSMVDQVIDEFTDNTGIDTTNSTNETLLNGYYSSGATTTASAAWLFGAQASGVAFGTIIKETGFREESYVFNGTQGQNQAQCGWYDPNSGGWVGKDAGQYSSIAASNFSMEGSSDYGWNNYASQGSVTMRLEYSDDNSTWTVEPNATQFSGTGAPGTTGGSFTESGFHRYWRINRSASSGGSLRVSNFALYGKLKTDTFNSAMSLQSTTTTAEATPTSGDLVVLMEDSSGTATLGTDILGYISRDGGSNWSSAVTWVDEGDWGTNKRVLVARNVNIGSLAGTTSMRWKINTANQSQGSKETRIHAVSLGWS